MDRPFVQVSVEGGRKNWLAPFLVRDVRARAARLIDHNMIRLTDEQKAALDNRNRLVESVRTAVIDNPNRTKAIVTDKDQLERAQAELDEAVKHRQKKLGELERWMVFFDAKGDEADLLLTIEDLAYFRMGALDLDNPDEDDKDEYGRWR